MAEGPRSARRPPPAAVSTAEGTSSAAFAPLDWGLLLAASLIWGSSFLLIAEGLEALEPGLITWLRILFGFAALCCSAGGPAHPRSTAPTGRGSPSSA